MRDIPLGLDHPIAIDLQRHFEDHRTRPGSKLKLDYTDLYGRFNRRQKLSAIAHDANQHVATIARLYRLYFQALFGGMTYQEFLRSKRDEARSVEFPANESLRFAVEEAKRAGLAVAPLIHMQAYKKKWTQRESFLLNGEVCAVHPFRQRRIYIDVSKLEQVPVIAIVMNGENPRRTLFVRSEILLAESSRVSHTDRLTVRVDPAKDYPPAFPSLQAA